MRKHYNVLLTINGRSHAEVEAVAEAVGAFARRHAAVAMADVEEAVEPTDPPRSSSPSSSPERTTVLEGPGWFNHEAAAPQAWKSDERVIEYRRRLKARIEKTVAQHGMVATFGRWDDFLDCLQHAAVVADRESRVKSGTPSDSERRLREIADDVERIQWAWGPSDSRREAVRAIAWELRRIAARSSSRVTPPAPEGEALPVPGIDSERDVEAYRASTPDQESR